MTVRTNESFVRTKINDPPSGMYVLCRPDGKSRMRLALGFAESLNDERMGGH
jgi:hypothetical protein